jgi:predicted nucleic acid-binding protein
LKTLRVYADTSVFGGCLDDEFSEESISFFKEVRNGKFILVLSTTTLRELEEAPDDVKKILSEIPVNHVELIKFSDEIKELRDAYLEAKILSETSKYDAEHIASASVAEADMIISWNFKHIVHYDKIIQYHSVNLLHGYKPIAIYSPKQVV